MQEKILKNEIFNKRMKLENLINSKCSLQDQEVMECSKELDKLIVRYFNIVNLKRCFTSLEPRGCSGVLHFIM
jgi:Spo0E like sporulation regulatory protein.